MNIIRRFIRKRYLQADWDWQLQYNHIERNIAAGKAARGYGEGELADIRARLDFWTDLYHAFGDPR